MGNFGRNKMIISFNCTECGGQLNFSYNREPKTNAEYDSRGDPTGADVCYAPNLWVEPCRKCIEKHTEPARKLTEAINELGLTKT